MKKIVLFFAVIIIICSQSPPVFPNQYEVSFSEASNIGPIKGNTTGRIYMDTTNNRQRIYRANGHYDRYCGTVFKFSNTPCNHYIADNKRYLDFPEKRYCCFCCDGAHGCGVVAPDWLVKANATYQGTEKLEDGGEYMKWDVKGLQENLYYHKNDTLKTPRRLYQVSDDLMDFNDYYVGIKDSSVFKLPQYCTQTCGVTTICAALRGQKALLRNE